jgi:DNA-binding MarR family transcriptional regulator
MENEQTALIVRGVLSLGRRLRAERPQGSVSLAAISILATLRRLGPIPATRLAAEERLQPQSLTRLIAGLEHEGLISRSPSEADRRELLITPTRQGLAVLAADIGARRRWLEKVMSATLNDAERDMLLKASEVMLKLANYDSASASHEGDERETREPAPVKAKAMRKSVAARGPGKA